MYIENGTVTEGVGSTQNFGNGINGETHLALVVFESTFDWTPSSDTNGDILTNAAAHEIGHTFKLGDCYPSCNGTSVMGAASANHPKGPTPCDNSAANQYGGYPAIPTPSPTPPTCQFTGEEISSLLIGQCDTGESPVCTDGVDNDCDGLRDAQDSGCVCTTPIVIDTLGNGLDLTSLADGVMFDIQGSGTQIQISWIQDDEAWLVLDRNGNGVIDSGAELFGNFTPQPVSNQANGFLALAEFDRTTQGGNGDGRLSREDAVFSSLRLWQDINHNALSEPDELHTLPAMGVAVIHLDYKEARRRDEHGNWFRYRAKVKDAHGAQLGRWAWDVFLLRAP
ncbi:MAG: hypothetical protein ACR2LM_16065 [Pyrinomonadaceae bacterium]